MMLRCTISIEKKAIQKYLGKKITEDEFAEYCKSAVLAKLFKEQFVPSFKKKIK